ncbi:hypothetical protein GCM10014715_47250 [Streptomyces spiralis]|uniref:ATP-binding protein n=1 Tax=Streptomyces spiralis TaxID=66376 RepID=A0A919DVQ0_9ACTN|nr:hypothetical protein GCM10014715_47250 [Streptomyces spiralis]
MSALSENSDALKLSWPRPPRNRMAASAGDGRAPDLPGGGARPPGTRRRSGESGRAAGRAAGGHRAVRDGHRGPSRSGDRRPGPVRLRLIVDNVLICEVFDASATAPHLRHSKTTDERGRGLFLISRFTRRWGTRHTRDGKVIWAEQSLAEPAGSFTESAGSLTESAG